MPMTTRLLALGSWLAVGPTTVIAAPAATAPPAPGAPSPPPRAPHPIPSEAGSDQFPDAPVRPGAWSENKLYRFRIERIEACGEGPAGKLKGEASWVGAFFTVEARQPEVFVTARDLELRRGGVILSATFANPPALPGCKPLLAAKRLRPGETISGFALFEVPRSFRVKTQDPIVFHYRPARWGGARHAEVPIPECFDACLKSWVSGEGKGATPPRAPAGRKL